MNHGQGFSANLATGILVILASTLGLPVSTTQVSVGALLGIGATTRQADFRVVSGILFSWLLTLPCAALLAGGSYWLLTHRCARAMENGGGLTGISLGRGGEMAHWFGRSGGGAGCTGAVAQWLEQATHNRLVAGSNPAGPTFARPHFP